MSKKCIQLQSAQFSILLKLDDNPAAAATHAAAVTSPQLHCVDLLQYGRGHTNLTSHELT
jgi:hypothetical protein